MPPQPKRILSFDGGGIRGIFSLQIAARIEQLFRDEYDQPKLVLSDVYGHFAGTSTGAIIAAFLALRAVERLQSIGRDYAAREVKREHLYSRAAS